ncbi:MAG: GNAT family N-acetyltransferase [Chloroflexi bacterium HGW-Chloroflexi-4]|jgi:RimJ/RimL family protein N-acetyltransferase|nr:MAG: GNAT family N-acetyltransferase [Chloroflexi bacterium HGW-Chloroflexi-8]PKO01318.1 MAG: GNAT family N-acetyltransferase [Chloroflexi bacterium HGW-Chloroflexi-4]
MKIRNISENDIDEFYLLCKKIDQESQFALLEPFEKAKSLEEQKEIVRSITRQKNKAIFIVEMDEQLVGYLGVFAGEYPLNYHCAKVTIGILHAYAGKGIGKQLFEILDKWSKEHFIHRLELSVSSHNELAINLFILMGFQYEGAKHDSLKTHNGFINEFTMAKLLG